MSVCLKIVNQCLLKVGILIEIQKFELAKRIYGQTVSLHAFVGLDKVLLNFKNDSEGKN